MSYQWYVVYSDVTGSQEYPLPHHLNHAMEEVHHIAMSVIEIDGHEYEMHLSSLHGEDRTEFLKWKEEKSGKAVKLVRKK